jgi:hypothetical protein
MAHITFIHGIANKPPKDLLHDLWLRSLSDDDGVDLGASGVTSSMVYWADVMYAEPLGEDGGEESADQEGAEVQAAGETASDTGWYGQIDGSEQLWTAALATKLNVALVSDEAAATVQAPHEAALERVPLPWVVKRRLMQTLLRDVHHYLFNTTYSPRPGATYRVRDEIRGRMLDALREGAAKPGPHIVVSHSMGTVIAYDCLKRCAGAPPVDALFTIGSPLGIDEIQDLLKPEWQRESGFPDVTVRGRWINVYDKLDPVTGFDYHIANDYRRSGAESVEDLNEQNYGRWRHDIRKYLAGLMLRGHLADVLRAGVPGHGVGA